MTPQERVKAATRRATQRLEDQRKDYEQNLSRGSLAPSSAFGRDLGRLGEPGAVSETAFENRNPVNMHQVLNPRPAARLRWQRKMAIRHVKHRGRMPKAMELARTERSHMSQSHFFKTSMKKLAPLARQIAGKSIDEAILQMRFSNKKVAQDVRQHLIQARNEAIVMKGMGLSLGDPSDASSAETTLSSSSPSSPETNALTAAAAAAAGVGTDPSETPALPHQTPLKTYKKGHTPSPTDIYVAEAWTNRGPYGQEPDYRARGRMFIMRPPHTGLTVLLKEEKTRTRQKAEKEAKALKKRTGKNMWVHLPDRKVTTQRQHVLW